MAGKYDFKPITKGDTTREIRITITDQYGNPIDLTGARVRKMMRKNFNTPPVMVFDTDDSTITIPEPEAGKIVLPKRPMDVPAYDYVYDLEVIFSDETVFTYLAGKRPVVNEVTYGK